MSLFGSVRPLDARSLAGPVVDVNVGPGTQLVCEGTVIGTFFLIRSGTAQLERGGRPVGSLGAGDCFGEIDPWDAEPQRYTVTATAPLRLWTFSTIGIGRLCDAIPGTRERILDSLPGDRVDVHPLARRRRCLSPALTGPLTQGGRVEHRNGAVIGGDPAELTHQPQRA